MENVPAKIFHDKCVALQTKLNEWDKFMAQRCPAHVRPERIISAVMSKVYSDPKIVDCTETSIIKAAVQCCSYGLEPDTPLQQCHLIPFAGECKLIMGYRGLITLAYNTGEISKIEHRIVYANEDFALNFGQRGEVLLSHSPAIDEEPGDYRLCYLWISLTGREAWPQFYYLTKRESDAIMKDSPGAKKSDSPWHTDYGPMAVKSLIKRSLKYLPLSPEKAERLLSAVARDNAAETGKAVPADRDFDEKLQQMGLNPDLEVKTEPEPSESESDPEPTPEESQATIPAVDAKITEWTKPQPDEVAKYAGWDKDHLWKALSANISKLHPDDWQAFSTGLLKAKLSTSANLRGLKKKELPPVLVALDIFTRHHLKHDER